MVLLNIDTLSTSELKYIASQENMDDWESLSRDELIYEIKDLYDGMDDDSKEFSAKKDLHKFCNCLTDVQFTKLMSLPGVEALPDEYLETSVHMIMKDPYWAYVFWSVSPNTRSECLDRDPDYRIFLKTIAFDKVGRRVESYDIDISDSDRSWNVELPWMGTTYQIELVVEYPASGEVEVLAVSEQVTNPEGIDQSLIEELRSSLQASMIFSVVASKNGELMDNKLVKDLFSRLNEEEIGSVTGREKR